METHMTSKNEEENTNKMNMHEINKINAKYLHGFHNISDTISFLFFGIEQCFTYHFDIFRL